MLEWSLAGLNIIVRTAVFSAGEPVGGLTGTKCLQGVMIASQSAGQVPLCAAHKQQEVIHVAVICSHFFLRELHGDNTPPLHTPERKDGLFAERYLHVEQRNTTFTRSFLPSPCRINQANPTDEIQSDGRIKSNHSCQQNVFLCRMPEHSSSHSSLSSHSIMRVRAACFIHVAMI